MIAVPLIVDSSNSLPFVRRGPEAEDQPTAWIVRPRQPAGEVDCRFTKERRIEPVVDKWRPQRKLPSSVARRRSKGSKVSSNHSWGRKKRQRLWRIRTRRRALIAAKEEE